MMFSPLGDSAVVIKLGEGADAGALADVGALAEILRREAMPATSDVVPAYGTVTVFYEAARWAGHGATPYEAVCQAIAHAVKRSGSSQGPAQAATTPRVRRVEIPVCYGGVYGPDLDEVSAHIGLAGTEVIARHSGAEYRVQAIGFLPGFPYLSGLPRELATPRRATPRTHVPAGAVGIGGMQTGIYPLVSPGGWRLIGRTPLTLFEVNRKEPAWLKVGDVVTFRVMTPEEFVAWK